jgi:hypothetical protein
MTSLQARKYDSLIALQNDDAKHSLWRSTAVHTPRSGSFATTKNIGKIFMPTPSYKRPHGSIGKSSHVNHGSFGGNGSKGVSNS